MYASNKLIFGSMAKGYDYLHAEGMKFGNKESIIILHLAMKQTENVSFHQAAN